MKNCQLSLYRAPALLAALALLGLGGAQAVQAQPSLTVGQESAAPGSVVDVPITYSSDGTVVALQFDLAFDSTRVILLEPLLQGASVDHLLAFSTPTDDSLRVVVYSPTRTPLQTGQLLTVPFAVNAAATAGIVPLTISAVVMGNANAGGVPPTQITQGSIQIQDVPLVAQLSITKTADLTIAQVGEPVVYTIVASNTGPRFAEGVGVIDIFPTALASCNWVCAPSAGATCSGSPIGGEGVGDVVDTVDLGPGATVTYTATCTFAPPEGIDVVVNTASITVPDPLTDPDLTNNESSRTTLSAITFVFVDGFETGDLSAWSGSVGRPTSIIDIPTDSRDHTETLRVDSGPLEALTAEPRSLIVGLGADGSPLLRVELRRSNRGLETRIHARTDDDLWESTEWQAISSRPRTLSVSWRRAWGETSRDGEILLSINSRLSSWLANLDTDRQMLDRILLFDIEGQEVLRALR